MNWTSVKNKLPSTKNGYVDQNVIVAVRNKNKPDGIFLYDVCSFDGESWSKRNNTWEDILFWRPFPKGPVEDEPKEIDGVYASDLITSLEEIIYEHGDLQLVTAKDEEGNSFNRIYYMPSVGIYDSEDKDFISIETAIEQCKDEDEDGECNEDFEVNAICVN